jgi:hypothetical protein
VALLHRRHILALGGAILVLVLAPAAVAANGTTVTVRVEGLKRTLLLPAVVHTHTGGITRGGTPHGSCSTTTAAGALDVATHHRWGGFWDKKYAALEVTSILGEKHAFTSTQYWSVWVDNRFAQFGVCGLKLHRGEQLLFAAVADTFSGFPLVLTTPPGAHAGQPFSVKVSYFDSHGKSKPLAHARVAGSGVSGDTDSEGTVKLTAAHPGTLTLRADQAGYIRSAPVSVRVMS